MEYVEDIEFYSCADCGRELPPDEVVTLIRRDDCVRGVCGRCWVKRRAALLS